MKKIKHNYGVWENDFVNLKADAKGNVISSQCSNCGCWNNQQVGEPVLAECPSCGIKMLVDDYDWT